MSALAFIVCMAFAFPRILGGWLAEVQHNYEAKLASIRAALLAKEQANGE